MNLKKKVTGVLSTIDDPELKEDVYLLGLIRNIQIDEEKKSVKMKSRPTAFQYPIGIQLAISIKKVLLEKEGLPQVDIEVIDFALAGQANIFLQSLDREKKQEVKYESGNFNR